MITYLFYAKDAFALMKVSLPPIALSSPASKIYGS